MLVLALLPSGTDFGVAAVSPLSAAVGRTSATAPSPCAKSDRGAANNGIGTGSSSRTTSRRSTSAVGVVTTDCGY